MMNYALGQRTWMVYVPIVILLCVQCKLATQPPQPSTPSSLASSSGSGKVGANSSGEKAQQPSSASGLKGNTLEADAGASRVDGAFAQVPPFAPLASAAAGQNTAVAKTQPGSTLTVKPSTTTPPPLPCIAADDFTCNAEEALVKYTNLIRSKHGLPPLTEDYRLSYVARDWSIKQGLVLSHTGFPDARGAVFAAKFPEASMPEIAAENVAFNSLQGDADAVGKALADQWEKSPQHYANIIGDYTGIGVGIKCAGSSIVIGDALSSPLKSVSSGSCTGTQIFSR